MTTEERDIKNTARRESGEDREYQRKRRESVLAREEDARKAQEYRDAHPGDHLQRVQKYNSENPEKVRINMRRARAKKLAKWNLLKIDRPCYDCGGIFPPHCMDWDHLPGTEKCFSISHCNSVSFDAVIDEIAKCQLVCANCHRIRTFAQKQSQKKGDE